MPPRPLVETLPENLKKELDKRLLNNGFSGYAELSDWLKVEGWEISKSSIHRYGKEFASRLHQVKLATEQARAIAAECNDEENSLGDALLRLVQHKAFEVLMEMESPGDVSLAALGRMVADLNRSGVALKKHMISVKIAVNERLSALEQKKNGLDLDTLRRVREEIYGLLD